MKKVIGCVGISFLLLAVAGILMSVLGPDGESEIAENSVANEREVSQPREPEVDRELIESKRQAVVGKLFSSLTLGEQKFKSVEVTSINDEGISLKHDGGLASVNWADVSEDVRGQWGFDPVALAQLEERKKEEAKRAAEEAEKAKKALAKAEAERTKNHVGAYVYMQQAVKRKLKSPTSADFPSPASKFCRPLGDYRYRVDAYVDSQNSFGAQIRTKFAGIIKENPGSDSWTVESLNIFE